MKWLKSNILPSFVKRFDRYLLLNKPLIWSSRIHRLLFFGLSALVLNFFFVQAIPLEYDQPIFEGSNLLIGNIIIGILLTVYWLYTQAMFNYRINNGITKPLHEFKVATLFFTVVFFIVLIITLPERGYSNRVKEHFIEQQIPSDIFYYSSLNHSNPVHFYQIVQNLENKEEIVLLGGLKSFFSEYSGSTDSVALVRDNSSLNVRVEFYYDRVNNNYSTPEERLHGSYEFYLDEMESQTIYSSSYEKTVESYKIPGKIYRDGGKYNNSRGRADELIIWAYEVEGKIFDAKHIQNWLITEKVLDQMGESDNYTPYSGLSIKTASKLIQLNEKLEKDMRTKEDYYKYLQEYSKQSKNKAGSQQEDLSSPDYFNKLQQYTFQYQDYADSYRAIRDSIEFLIHESENYVIPQYDSGPYKVLTSINSASMRSTKFNETFVVLFILASLITYLSIFATYLVKYFGVRSYVLGLITPVLMVGGFVLIQLLVFDDADVFFNLISLVVFCVVCGIIVKVRGNRRSLSYVQWLIYLVPLLLFMLIVGYKSIFGYYDYDFIYGIDKVYLPKRSSVNQELLHLGILSAISYFLFVPIFANKLFKIYSSPS